MGGINPSRLELFFSPVNPQKKNSELLATPALPVSQALLVSPSTAFRGACDPFGTWESRMVSAGWRHGNSETQSHLKHVVPSAGGVPHFYEFFYEFSMCVSVFGAITTAGSWAVGVSMKAKTPGETLYPSLGWRKSENTVKHAKALEELPKVHYTGTLKKTTQIHINS